MSAIGDNIKNSSINEPDLEGNGPIPREISGYFSRVKNLEQFPYSQRIFSEVHSASIALLDRLGKTEGRGLKKKRVYEFIDGNTDLGLRIEYGRNGLIGKCLTIRYIAEESVMNTLDMITSLGAQNIRELYAGDEVTRITRGGMGITSRKGLRKILDTLTQYQPDRLHMFNEGNLVHKQIY